VVNPNIFILKTAHGLKPVNGPNDWERKSGEPRIFHYQINPSVAERVKFVPYRTFFFIFYFHIPLFRRFLHVCSLSSITFPVLCNISMSLSCGKKFVLINRCGPVNIRLRQSRVIWDMKYSAARGNCVGCLPTVQHGPTSSAEVLRRLCIICPVYMLHLRHVILAKIILGRRAVWNYVRDQRW